MRNSGSCPLLRTELVAKLPAPRLALQMSQTIPRARRRLFPLTKARTLPAIPMAGNYRLIDICLSNLVNSNIRRVRAMTWARALLLGRVPGWLLAERVHPSSSVPASASSTFARLNLLPRCLQHALSAPLLLRPSPTPPQIYVLNQFNSKSLNSYLQHTYDLGGGFSIGGEGHVEVVSAAQVRRLPL